MPFGSTPPARRRSARRGELRQRRTRSAWCPLPSLPPIAIAAEHQGRQVGYQMEIAVLANVVRMRHGRPSVGRGLDSGAHIVGVNWCAYPRDGRENFFGIQRLCRPIREPRLYWSSKTVKMLSLRCLVILHAEQNFALRAERLRILHGPAAFNAPAWRTSLRRSGIGVCAPAGEHHRNGRGGERRSRLLSQRASYPLTIGPLRRPLSRFANGVVSRFAARPQAPKESGQSSWL